MLGDRKGSALAFSGGLDSTLLLALSGYTLKPYTVGFSDSHDIARSRYVAELLGFKINEILLDDCDLAEAISVLKSIDPSIGRPEIGYELVLYYTLSEIGEDHLVTGQGADEIFYGYRRFVDNPDMVNGEHLDRLFRITLPRETAIAGFFSKSLITPYLDSRIVEKLSRLPRNVNIINGINKIQLRDLARNTGLPEEIWNFRKKAAQYGSGIQARLKKISDLY